MRRWQATYVDAKCEIDLALKASHILVKNEQREVLTVTEEMVSFPFNFKFKLKKKKRRKSDHSYRSDQMKSVNSEKLICNFFDQNGTGYEGDL